MRILILDDEQYRHDVFTKRFEGAEIVSAYTYDDAVTALKNSAPFDLVQLDHDLGFKSLLVLPDGFIREATGYDAAKFIAFELPQAQWPKKVVIHSLNAGRTKVMRDTLTGVGIDAIIEPFRLPGPLTWCI